MPTNHSLFQLTDLNTSINTLRHSYGSIIRSLANLQNRRAKKAQYQAHPLAPVPVIAADEDQQAPDGSGSLTTTIEDICERITVDYAERYNLDRFLDSTSRDGVFGELFREVNEINTALAPFKTFFDGEGYFQPTIYKAQDEFVLTRAQYGNCLKVVSFTWRRLTSNLQLTVFLILNRSKTCPRQWSPS